MMLETRLCPFLPLLSAHAGLPALLIAHARRDRPLLDIRGFDHRTPRITLRYPRHRGVQGIHAGSRAALDVLDFDATVPAADVPAPEHESAISACHRSHAG